MPETINTIIASWLKLLCGMIPGIAQAVVLTNVDAKSDSDSDSTIKWPQTANIHDDLMSAAKLAASQNKSVTTTLSTSSGNDSVVDMVIAVPLKKAANFAGTLAILVKVKPSQQSVVMQILHWGEDWLALILEQISQEQISHGQISNGKAAASQDRS